MTSGRAVKIIACVVAAVLGLAVAVAAGGRAHAELARKPTSAELAAAAAAGAAQRWEREPTGTIFPASIGYTSDLLTKETAGRVGIAPEEACAAAVDASLASRAQHDGCVAALRADYTDQLRGAVYTLGVLAFGSTAKASDFYNGIPTSSYPATGLHALAVPGTAAALFGDAARQASTAQLAGPYVVLAVAGYADGRPASTAAERRDSVFDPAGQLVSAVAAPLGLPVAVHCGSTEWACNSVPAPNLPAPPPTLDGIRPFEMQTLDQIDVPAAWRTSKGEGVTVAVLDTGVDPNAPDLVGDVTTGPDYTAGADPPGFQPPRLHGTYIASLIAAHGEGPGDSQGVIGVAPDAKILAVRVILDDGEPGQQAYNEDQRFANAISNGIYYAVRHGATVINMSLGSQQTSASMRSAVAYAVAHGVVVVASAGNSGTTSGFAPYVYPASFPGVIAVGAVNSSDDRYSFSEQNAAVVLGAPGWAVLGAGPDGEYLDAEGTSPSAALVSGVAALIRSRYPRLSASLVEQALIKSVTDRPRSGYSVDSGFGELNAAAALRAAATLAAGTPATGVAPAAFFAANQAGHAPGAGATAPIQVVHRDKALIAGYVAGAGAGLVCAIVSLLLLTGIVRRSRRDQRRQQERSQWQQSAWAGQASPPAWQGGYPPQANYPPPAGYPPQNYPQRNYPPQTYPPPVNYPPPPAGYPPPPGNPYNHPPPASYPPAPPSSPPPSGNYRDYPNGWFDPQ